MSWRLSFCVQGVCARRRDRLSRAHQHTNWRGGLVVCGGALINGVRAVDAEQRWDARGPDVEDPGVCDLTVDLHHHFELFVLDDAVIYVHGGQNHRHLWSTSFIVVGGRK